MMKKKNFCVLLTAGSLLLTGCGVSSEKGKLVEALNQASWQGSEWISVVNAPIVTNTVNDGSRAADGANWFVSTVKNPKKVVSAKWMTSGWAFTTCR